MIYFGYYKLGFICRLLSIQALLTVKECLVKFSPQMVEPVCDHDSEDQALLFPAL